MENNYRKLAVLVRELDEARKEMNKVARARIGVISGGPSIDEENRAFDLACTALSSLDDYLSNLESEAQSKKEYRREA